MILYLLIVSLSNIEICLIWNHILVALSYNMNRRELLLKLEIHIRQHNGNNTEQHDHNE